jgi:hypothetical protein
VQWLGRNEQQQNMSYEIIIKERREVKKIVGKEWATIGTKEVPRDETYYQQDKSEPKTRIEDVRGYTPEIEKTVTEEREVLKQTVDSASSQQRAC